MYNIANLKKEEILKRHFWRCVHGHTGLAHPKCYEQAHGVKEKIGFWDIEATNLSSDFGIILSYAIKYEGGYISRLITPQEIKKEIYDKNLIRQLCDDLRKFDRIVTYYGTKFDFCFGRSRAVYWGLDFPTYKEIKHTDAYYIVKNKLGTIHSRRLGVVAPFFGIPAKASPLNPEVWFRCMSGNQKALNYVMKHNLEDVDSLSALWDKINRFTRIGDTSI